MRAQYPSSSTSPRTFLKAHQVLAAMTAAVLVTAAVAASLGAWQLSDGSDDNSVAGSAGNATSTFDRIEYTTGSGTASSVRIATVDELLAIHEALTASQFDSEEAEASSAGPMYPASREGVRGPVTID